MDAALIYRTARPTVAQVCPAQADRGAAQRLSLSPVLTNRSRVLVLAAIMKPRLGWAWVSLVGSPDKSGDI